MKRYVSLYWKLIQVNFSRLVAYKANLVNSIISSTVWGVFTVVSIIILTSRLPYVYGWTRDELILLTTSYSIVIGFFHSVFSKNFERFSHLVHFGQFDSILLKPADAQFLVSFWLVNFTSLLRVVLGILLTAYYIGKLHIEVTMLSIVGYIATLIIGIILLYSVWFGLMTLTIWFTRLSNIVELLYSIGTIGRFPRQMYQEFLGYIFYFLLPLTFFVITPTKVLIQRATPADFAGLFGFAVLLFYLSRRFWLFALRSYSSASS